MLQKSVIFTLFIFFSIISYAGPGTGQVTLKEVRIESGNVYLFTQNSISNPLNCTIADIIKLEPNDAGFDQMYSAALTSLTTGNKIKIWLRSCTNSPWGKTVPKA